MRKKVAGVELELTDDDQITLSAPYMRYELTVSPERALEIASEMGSLAVFAMQRREAKSGVQSWTCTSEPPKP